MRLSSSAFSDGEKIPPEFGRNFRNVNPPLMIEDVLDSAVSLAIIMDDPDMPPEAPVRVWDHWVVFNIPPSVSSIPEAWIVEGVRGRGTRGELEYGGPRPPDREHRYFFKLFTLDCMLSLAEGASKTEVIEAMEGHVLEQAELMGRYAPSK
ncbi:MAG: YbhB/YbcL family Raf kinase inhibitor-like protein [Patescibacteria group bacterium]|jgi:hypothetical protein